MTPCRHRAAQNVLVDMDAFVRDGYMLIHGAFDANVAAACRGADLGLHGWALNPLVEDLPLLPRATPGVL